MQRSKELMIDAAIACSASVFYVSAIFLPDMISVKSTGLSLLYIVVAGLLFSLTMISKDKKTVFIKWLISGFFGFAVGLIINLFLRVKDYERFRKIQLVICMTVAVAVIAVVFILERQFPSSDLIHS